MQTSLTITGTLSEIAQALKAIARLNTGVRVEGWTVPEEAKTLKESAATPKEAEATSDTDTDAEETEAPKKAKKPRKSRAKKIKVEPNPETAENFLDDDEVEEDEETTLDAVLEAVQGALASGDVAPAKIREVFAGFKAKGGGPAARSSELKPTDYAACVAALRFL